MNPEHSPARKVETKLQARRLHPLAGNEIVHSVVRMMFLEVVEAVVERRITGSRCAIAEIAPEVGFNIHQKMCVLAHSREARFGDASHWFFVSMRE